MRMRRGGAQARTAGVPAKMMQFVAYIGQGHLRDQLAVAFGLLVEINHAQNIRAFAFGIQHRHIGELFLLSLHGHSGRGIKSWIGFPLCHYRYSWRMFPRTATLSAWS